MAAMRASTRLLKVLQQSTAFQGVMYQPQPLAAAQQVSTPTQGILRRFFAADGGQAARHDHADDHYEKIKMVNEGGADHTTFSEASDEVRKSKGAFNPIQEESGRMAEKGKRVGETAEDVVDKGKDYAKGTYEAASNKFSDVSSRGKEKAEEAQSTVGRKREEVMDRAEETKERAKERVGETTEKAKQMAEETKERAGETTEKAKQMAEETKESAKGKTQSVVDKTKETAEKTKEKTQEVTENAQETAQGLKEVGVEAIKAVKRDAEKLAEKIGIKERKPGDLDRTEA